MKDHPIQVVLAGLVNGSIGAIIAYYAHIPMGMEVLLIILLCLAFAMARIPGTTT